MLNTKTYEINQYVDVKSKAWAHTVFIGCLCTLLIMPISTIWSGRVFYFSGFVAMLVVLNDLKFFTKKNHAFLLAMIIFLIGVSNIIWLLIYYSMESHFQYVYTSYFFSGIAGILSSFIVLLAFSNKKESCIYLIYGIIFTSLITITYAFYQEYFSATERIALIFGSPTSAAYYITFIGILSSQAILRLNINHKFIYYFIHFLLISASIIFTETRAAIFVYPTIGIALLLAETRHNKKLIIKTFAGFIIITLLCSFMFKDILHKRTTDLLHDLQMYSMKNSQTSVGARFAMYQAGLMAGLNTPIGQSADQRADFIQEMIKENKVLSGAAPYLNVHMHNELIDAFSLKGIIGAALIACLYVTLIYTSFSAPINYAGMALTFALIMYGLSDVILYSRDTFIAWALTFSLSVLLNSSGPGQANTNIPRTGSKA
ncbi:O-antigen ligase family protein [Brenneria goodwinii]|uniref:O-antigen ligase n=2 Tax=Brenneria goodwinii TaxID=1109412 RepID=A0A0G4JTW5_9GAMM|nr:O-antigen ligase [Brenneria goodwinii]